MQSDETPFAPTFLSVEDVVGMHEAALSQFGGASGLRDFNLLESAVMSPQQTFGGELLLKSFEEIAAAYWIAIDHNQPFLDGNKRTALLACDTFLMINGYELSLDDQGGAYEVAMRVARNEISRSELAEIIRRNVRVLR